MKKIPNESIFELLSNAKGNYGIYINNLGNDELLTINSNTIFPAASIIKIPLLIYLLKKVENGEINYDIPCDISISNRVGGTGILNEIDNNIKLSTKSLATLMITLSDNTATNEIIDMVGIDNFNNFCKTTLGCKNTILMRKMLDFEAIRQGKNNYTTASDIGEILTKIALKQCISPWISDEINRIMSLQQCRNKLPALIPAVPSWASKLDKINIKPNTVLVCNKTGDLTCIQHDVGIFTLPDNRKYIISVFSSDLESDGDGILTIAKLSKLVYNALK